MVAKISAGLANVLARTKATAALRVHFAETVIAEPGTKVTPAVAKPAPTLWIDKSKTKSDARYLALSLDVDAPFPSWPVLSPILHMFSTDLTVGEEAAGEAGWAPLTGSDPLVSYIGPNPPRPSSGHRYVFLVWEQPADLTAGKIREGLGWGNEEVKRLARMRFDQEGFEKKFGLGEPVAGNFFLSEHA